MPTIVFFSCAKVLKHIPGTVRYAFADETTLQWPPSQAFLGWAVRLRSAAGWPRSPGRRPRRSRQTELIDAQFAEGVRRCAAAWTHPAGRAHRLLPPIQTCLPPDREPAPSSSPASRANEEQE